MSVRVVVVVHSDRGTTRQLGDAVVRGVQAAGGDATLVDVGDVDWDALARADAVVFGSPTYLGSVSGRFKQFMDDSSERAWAAGAWRDKVAATFTVSASPSGDKLFALQQLVVFAAQHGMLWVGLDLFPGLAAEAPNRLGSYLGAMAAVPVGGALPQADLDTAAHLGQRVATVAARWAAGRPAAPSGVHPASQDWALPPAERPPLPDGLQRVNLRTLMARPERFEHHLVVVATLGGAQLEAVTASEPLAFAHVNRTDEYAAALPTGDPRLGALRFLTLLSDPASGEDVGRIKHGEGDLVLHPQGLLHWPGRLRPPYRSFPFPPGARRARLSLVLCGSQDLGPGARPIAVPPGRADDVKAYGEAPVPFGLADLQRAAPGPSPRSPGPCCRWSRAGRAGVRGWLLVLAGDAPLFPGDLVRIPAGAALSVERGLLLAGAVEPDPPPPSWDALPQPAFAPAEDAPPGALPVEVGPLVFEATDDPEVMRVSGEGVSAEVPRKWAARMLFRVGLHGLRLGYLETYGGLFWDDRGGHRIGLRGRPVAELRRGRWCRRSSGCTGRWRRRATGSGCRTDAQAISARSASPSAPRAVAKASRSSTCERRWSQVIRPSLQASAASAACCSARGRSAFARGWSAVWTEPRATAAAAMSSSSRRSATTSPRGPPGRRPRQPRW
ncbi:MAG: flavodoxin family protein [Myxococcota bacterium]